jgi:uncharacterized protein YjiS (DUF1127 family)
MKTTFFGATIPHSLGMPVWAAVRAAARIAALPDLFYDWQWRARTRRQLMTMDHRLLKDMGISRYDAVREGGKPFWRK